jgi:hypothetical protein
MSIMKKSLRRRLAFDYRVVMAMAKTSSLIRVEAYANPHDLKQRRQQITDERAESAGYYHVHYDIGSLVRGGNIHHGFDVEFDLISRGTYPESRGGLAISAGGITATCVSQLIPWSPHFLDGIGTICLGSIWRGADHTLLSHVIIHVAKLLNWDECMASTYSGWYPDATEWWKKNLGGKPIKSGLEYPTLPLDLTHGIAADTTAYDSPTSENPAAFAEADDFRVIRTSNALSTFKSRTADIIIL